MGQGEGVGVGGCAHNLISRRAPNVSPASAGGRRHQWPAACPAHGAGEREQYEPKTPHKTEPLWIPMRIFRSSLFLRLIRLLIGPGVISKCGQCECARPTQHFRGGATHFIALIICRPISTQHFACSLLGSGVWGGRVAVFWCYCLERWLSRARNGPARWSQLTWKSGCERPNRAGAHSGAGRQD